MYQPCSFQSLSGISDLSLSLSLSYFCCLAPFPYILTIILLSITLCIYSIHVLVLYILLYMPLKSRTECLYAQLMEHSYRIFKMTSRKINMHTHNAYLIIYIYITTCIRIIIKYRRNEIRLCVVVFFLKRTFIRDLNQDLNQVKVLFSSTERNLEDQ